MGLGATLLLSAMWVATSFSRTSVVNTSSLIAICSPSYSPLSLPHPWSNLYFVAVVTCFSPVTNKAVYLCGVIGSIWPRVSLQSSFWFHFLARPYILISGFCWSAVMESWSLIVSLITSVSFGKSNWSPWVIFRSGVHLVWVMGLPRWHNW